MTKESYTGVIKIKLTERVYRRTYKYEGVYYDKETIFGRAQALHRSHGRW